MRVRTVIVGFFAIALAGSVLLGITNGGSQDRHSKLESVVKQEMESHLKQLGTALGLDWKCSRSSLIGDHTGVASQWKNGQKEGRISVSVYESADDAKRGLEARKDRFSIGPSPWQQNGLDEAVRYGESSGSVVGRRGNLVLLVVASGSEELRTLVAAALASVPESWRVQPSTQPSTTPNAEK